MKLLLKIIILIVSLTMLGREAGAAESYGKEMSRFAFEEALTQYREGHEIALKTMEEYVEERPDDVQAALTLAEIYLERDSGELARRLYERVAETSPENLEAHRQLVRLYSWEGMAGKLLKEYEAIVSLVPSDLETRRTLARKLVEHGRQPEAISQYEEILKQDAGDIQSRKMLADLYLWNGRAIEAAKQYRSLLKTEPDNPEIIRKTADIYYDFQLYAEAGKYYEQSLLTGDDPKNRQRLREISKKRRPWLSPGYYYHHRGDGYTHSYYSLDYGQYLKDYFDYTFSYSRHRYAQSGKSVDADSYQFEVTNYFFNSLTFSEKIIVNDYSPGETRLNGSLKVKKNFLIPLYLEGSLSYEDIDTEVKAIDAAIKATFLEGYLYYDLNPSWSFSWWLKQGFYSDDNDELESEGGVVYHLKKKPLLDLAYAYRFDSFSSPDTSSKVYPYWNPENYEVHSLLVTWKHEPEKKFSYLLQETLAWAVQDEALLNGLRARVDYRYRKNREFFADYSRTDTLTGTMTTRFKEWILRAGCIFYF